jgi:hypothetical protein
VTQTLNTKFVATALVALGLGLLGAPSARADLKFVIMLDEPGAHTHEPLPKPAEANKNRAFRYTAPGVEGAFILDANGEWGELTGPPGATLEKGLKVHLYTLSKRNPFYIELSDASRGVTVRVYDNACYIKTANSGGKWAHLGAGKWGEL